MGLILTLPLYTRPHICVYMWHISMASKNDGGIEKYLIESTLKDMLVSTPRRCFRDTKRLKNKKLVPRGGGISRHDPYRTQPLSQCTQLSTAVVQLNF